MQDERSGGPAPADSNAGAPPSDARVADDAPDGERELSPEEEVVVAARARGLSHQAVGDLIGTSDRTARRRAGDPVVAEAIRRRREEQATEMVGQLAALLPDAVATLGSGLGSEKDHDRLRASQLIVELFLKVRRARRGRRRPLRTSRRAPPPRARAWEQVVSRDNEARRMLAALRAEPDPVLARIDPAPIPNIIDFVVGAEYLNRPGLYPRQATLLKIIFLQDDLFTPYDHDVIGEWIERLQGDGQPRHRPGRLERIRDQQGRGAPVVPRGRRGHRPARWQGVPRCALRRVRALPLPPRLQARARRVLR